MTTYNRPGVSGRVYVDSYELEIGQISSANSITLKLYCEIDATQSMTNAEIAQAMMNGQDVPFCNFCGKVIVSV